MARIKPLDLEIRADTAQLKKAVQDVRKEMESLVGKALPPLTIRIIQKRERSFWQRLIYLFTNPVNNVELAQRIH